MQIFGEELHRRVQQLLLHKLHEMAITFGTRKVEATLGWKELREFLTP